MDRGPQPGTSLIASLPDVSELGVSLERWKPWFSMAARLVLEACPNEGVTIFYQTDIKHNGVWVDKGYLCQQAAERVGHSLLWHKIVCRKPPGTTTMGRPTYAHLLCFSRVLRPETSRASADVLPEPGSSTWNRGMGLTACNFACRYVLENTATRTIVNPFCGQGQLLSVANGMGLEAVGIELNRKRAEIARRQGL